MRTRYGAIAIASSVCAPLLFGACGGAAPPSANSAGESSGTKRREASSAPCVSEQARALALAQAADALTPPVAPPPGGKAQALAFMKGPLTEWVKSRRAASDQADQALSAALACSPNAEQSRWLFRHGQVQGHFATAFLRVGVAAMPTEFRGDPQLKKLWIDGLAQAIAPQVERARSSFEACLALGSRARPADSSACGSELAALPAASSVVPVSASGAPKPPPHLAYPRPFVRTSQPKPCTFAGTLMLWRPALKIGSREVARMEQVELSHLSLPSSRSGAFVMQTTWPIRAPSRWRPVRCRSVYAHASSWAVSTSGYHRGRG